MDNQMNQNGSNELRSDSVISEKEEGASLEKETHHSHHSHHSHHGEHHHGSSHHHHHHHHHNSHRSSGNKKKKRNVNKTLMWAISISIFVLLVVLVVLVETMNVDRYRGEQHVIQTNDVLSVEVINEEGVLVKNAVNKYLLTDLLNSNNATVLLSDFSTAADGRLDAQVPVVLKLSTKDDSAISYKIELADNAEFSNAMVDYVYKSFVTYEFKHLYANTSYFYRVTAYTQNGNAVQTGSFKTADTPRILSIDGLSNVRDVGNWRTDSGKRIKQGLLIRGTEMDGAVESGYHLTNDGLMDMLDVFGIKTDIDLRAQSSMTMDALGSRVVHRYYNMVMYDGIFNEAGKEKIRTVFADLANPDNYPIYLHCTYGCDRTGTVCYLLEALLGVSRGDCLKDYGLSNMNIAKIQVVENGLKAYEGNTLKEQVESYLLSCGVSEYQIESIRNIFLEY